MKRMAGKLTTLTVQDMLWVNLQITKVSKTYHFARLEEATFNQYGYGGSVDVIGQAAKFVTEFVRMKPFSAGNEATAFVALIAFMECNGKALALEPERALEWVRGIWADPSSAEAAITVLVDDHHVHLHHGVPEKRAAIVTNLEKYKDTVMTLLAEEPEAALA